MKREFGDVAGFLDSCVKKIEDDDDDDDDEDDDVDGAFPFQRRRFVLNSCYPKNIQENKTILAIIVSSVNVTQKCLRTP
jgi:hypothetical protein